MTTGAPNIVLIMSDQHRADMMGCAGDASVLTPSLDALASRGRALLPGVVPGPAVHAVAGLVHDRALRPRPRRLHELVRDTAGEPDLRLGPAGGRVPHRRSWARHTSTSTSSSRCRTSDDMAGRLEALGFAEVFETGDKFVGKIPTRYTDYLSARGLLDAYKKHIADRSYQGENEDGRNATKCVPMWDSTPMPIPLESYVDAWHGQQAVRVDRALRPPRAVLPLRGLPGSARPLGRTGGGRAALPGRRHLHAALDPAPHGRGDGSLRRAAERVPVGLRLRVDDRRRHPGDAALLRRRHLGHRPGRGRHGRCAGAHGRPRQHVDHLHQRPRRDGGQPRPDVQVRPLRAGRPRPADRPAAGRMPATRRGLPGGAPRRPGHGPRIAGAPEVAHSEGRSLLAGVHGRPPRRRATRTVSENWGFAAFETERHKLVVDEDALEPCQLFDLSEDPAEDHDLLPDPVSGPVVEEIMETHVRPFFRTPPARPIPSFFTGGYDELSRPHRARLSGRRPRAAYPSPSGSAVST